jgi:hypothetical protein
VSTARNALYDLYRGRGFEDMGLHTEVVGRRVDGSVTTDRRVFLSRILDPDDRPNAARGTKWNSAGGEE